MKIEKVDKVVLKVMGDLSAGKPGIQSKILRIWPAVCDKKTKQHTAVAGFKEGSLVVNVDSPAWLFQMNLQKRKILRILKDEMPELSNIRFKIGKTK